MKWTTSRKAIQSLRLTNQYLSGRPQCGGTTKWLSYKNLKVQGSYEYRACLILDKFVANGLITGWNYDRRRIKYMGVDGKEHLYIVDFSVLLPNGTLALVETKGWIQPKDWLKWRAAIAQGYVLLVWMKLHLEDYESGALPDFSCSSLPS